MSSNKDPYFRTDTHHAMIDRKTKLRVAHLIYSEKVGGSETVAANICSRLDRDRFDPMVLFYFKSQGSMPRILERLGVPCAGFGMTRSLFLLRPFLVARLLKRLKIDMLHVHHVRLYLRVASGARLARLKGIIVTEHAKFSISRSPRLQEGCRKTARSVDFFTVVSNNLKQYFVETLRVPESRIKVVPNGIDTRRFQPCTQRGELAALLPQGIRDDKDKKIIITVGRFAEAKDHFTLLAAVRQLARHRQDFHLVMIGDGELHSAVEQRIKELELESYITTPGSRSDVDSLMPGADLFVLSSKREGLPMVVMEAMACGLPVVATKVGGIPEVVHHGENGALVPPGKPEQLAAALDSFLEDPQKAADMGHAARNLIAERYDLDVIAARYAALYSSL